MAVFESPTNSLENYRLRLRKMSDQELFKVGRAARSVCVCGQRHDTEDPLKTQLDEAREEWRRRYPKQTL